MIYTGAIANSRDNYLAAAGPTPLKFRLEIPRLDPAKALPPLLMADLVISTNTTDEVTLATPVIPPAIDEGPENVATTIGADTSSTTMDKANDGIPKSEPTMTEARTQTSAISPQMLLRFFRGGTNEVLVPYPVDFTPPIPENRADSSAVYISK